MTNVPAWAAGPGRPSLRTQRLVADGAVAAILAIWALAASSAPSAILPDPGRVLPLTFQLNLLRIGYLF
mgnify:CR=1 FL=1